MATKEVMSLSIPRDVRAWIVAEAGKRRLSISETMLVLLTRGIQGEALDTSIKRIETAMRADSSVKDVLREVLELRFMVSQIVKQVGADRVTLTTDARLYAEREFAKRSPQAHK